MRNFLDAATSSMSNRLEYLVKYSVAPPPSRDYYGLKVLQNEIILHWWKISHGPHKTPIVHCAKFSEFDQEKTLQDEIRRGFGEHLLEHVKSIAEGNRNTLLTLPKSLIERISGYLKFTDIVKLASLSHVAYEVFNTDSLWQILFTRDKRVKITAEEGEKIKVYGWKQLYKGRQMQSMKDRKNFRIQSFGYTSDAKINKLSLRPSSGISMPKTISTTNMAVVPPKDRSEFSNMELITTSLSKASSDTRFRGTTGTNTNAGNEKSFSQKKNPISKFNMNEKNVKRDNITAPKLATNREIKSGFKHGKAIDSQPNQQHKLEKCVNKLNVTTRSHENKMAPVLSKTPSLSKNMVDNVKSTSNLGNQKSSRIRSKTKTKAKKLTTTQSEIFNADKELSDNSFMVRDGDNDLADLIEASLKNIRSPRNIFDYDFSSLQQSHKSAARYRNEIQNIERLKQLKPMRGSVITNYLSERMTRGNEILEKLSEKSEPFSGTSCESLANDKKALPGGDNRSSLLSEKYRKARAELQKSLDWKTEVTRGDPTSSENRWNSSSTTNLRSKLQSPPTKIDSNDDKPPIARGPVKTNFLMKAYNSKNLESKKDAKSCETVIKNRTESTKLVRDIERNQLIK